MSWTAVGNASVTYSTAAAASSSFTVEGSASTSWEDVFRSSDYVDSGYVVTDYIARAETGADYTDAGDATNTWVAA